MQSEEYREYMAEVGVHPKKYIVGDAADGHQHIVYILDDLPRATSTSTMIYDSWHHEHSIEAGSDGTLVCQPANNHTHTIITLVE